MALDVNHEISCKYYNEVTDPEHVTQLTRQVSMRLIYPSCLPWDHTCPRRGGAYVAAVTVCRQRLWL